MNSSYTDTIVLLVIILHLYIYLLYCMLSQSSVFEFVDVMCLTSYAPKHRTCLRVFVCMRERRVSVFCDFDKFSSVSAHVCLMSPPQRGGLVGSNKVASNTCYQTMGPCGNTTQGPSSVTYKRGQTVEIVINKNLDHFQPAAPGNFTVTPYFYGEEYPLLALLPDTDAPSLSLYNVSFTIPTDISSGIWTLQVV